MLDDKVGRLVTEVWKSVQGLLVQSSVFATCFFV